MNRDEMNKIIGMSEEEMDLESYMLENDLWEGRLLGEAKSGRPSLFAEPMKPLTIREPEFVLEILDKRASEKGVSRSAYARDLINAGLFAHE